MIRRAMGYSFRCACPGRMCFRSIEPWLDVPHNPWLAHHRSPGTRQRPGLFRTSDIRSYMCIASPVSRWPSRPRRGARRGTWRGR